MKVPDLYQEILLSHYRAPRNRGVLEAADARARVENPVCGDVIELDLTLNVGRISALRFRGQGCVISQASASMMTELLAGCSPEEAMEKAEALQSLLRGDEETAKRADLKDLRALAGVGRLPGRIRCALLAWEALRQVLPCDEV